eukprot:TRINITY_DN15688_c0_g1_i4.p2 TRINITY_DN15688_c0_g1~~TRINITY_DN15688_c0_g1_i4.p2  ORF type:complete len:118 (+),score=17.12 TRINITY_DN15688_c0_g1_i4:43-396(+)
MSVLSNISFLDLSQDVQSDAAFLAKQAKSVPARVEYVWAHLWSICTPVLHFAHQWWPGLLALLFAAFALLLLWFLFGVSEHGFQRLQQTEDYLGLTEYRKGVLTKVAFMLVDLVLDV